MTQGFSLGFSLGLPAEHDVVNDARGPDVDLARVVHIALLSCSGYGEHLRRQIVLRTAEILLRRVLSGLFTVGSGLFYR